MKLINIGFGNTVSQDRILAVISPESAPVKRMCQEAKAKGILIDASFGRATKSVVVMDSGHIVLSSLACDVLASRLDEAQKSGEGGMI